MILNTIKHKNMLFFLLLVHSFTQTSLVPAINFGGFSRPSLPSLDSLPRLYLETLQSAAPIAATTLAGAGLVYYMGRTFSPSCVKETFNKNPKLSFLGILGLGSIGRFVYHQSIMEFFAKNPISHVITQVGALSNQSKLMIGAGVATGAGITILAQDEKMRDSTRSFFARNNTEICSGILTVAAATAAWHFDLFGKLSNLSTQVKCNILGIIPCLYFMNSFKTEAKEVNRFKTEAAKAEAKQDEANKVAEEALKLRAEAEAKAAKAAEAAIERIAEIEREKKAATIAQAEALAEIAVEEARMQVEEARAKEKEAIRREDAAYRNFLRDTRAIADNAFDIQNEATQSKKEADDLFRELETLINLLRSTEEKLTLADATRESEQVLQQQSTKIGFYNQILEEAREIFKKANEKREALKLTKKLARDLKIPSAGKFSLEDHVKLYAALLKRQEQLDSNEIEMFQKRDELASMISDLEKAAKQQSYSEYFFQQQLIDDQTSALEVADGKRKKIVRKKTEAVAAKVVASAIEAAIIEAAQ